jgi:hypothetical protein
MDAIAKAGDSRDQVQVRPGERANLITIPAQTNLVFLKYPATLRALPHDVPLSRPGARGLGHECDNIGCAREATG